LDKTSVRPNLIFGAIQAEANTEIIAALKVVIIERAFLRERLRRESQQKN
jgi:hypothetical protein